MTLGPQLGRTGVVVGARRAAARSGVDRAANKCIIGMICGTLLAREFTCEVDCTVLIWVGFCCWPPGGKAQNERSKTLILM